MGTWIVLGILAVCVVLAVSSIRKDKKKGGCPGGCAGCSGACHCPSKEAGLPKAS